MRVLVWKKAPADRRRVTPMTRSSIQSRPVTTRVGSPEVTSATPSFTACTSPTSSGWAAPSGPASRSTAVLERPGEVTTVTSTWPVAMPSRTTHVAQVARLRPLVVRRPSPRAAAHARTLSRTALPSGVASRHARTSTTSSQRPRAWMPDGAAAVRVPGATEYSILLR